MIKPILFNTEMVRAILDGRKTVTRRVVKLKYSNTHLEMRTDKYGTRLIEIQNEEPGVTSVRNPDGTTTHTLLAAVERMPPYRPGDILYVPETFRIDYLSNIQGTGCVHYKADDAYGDFSFAPERYEMMRRAQLKSGWKPSKNMPREAARLFLRVTDVRVERLKDITEEQATDEGQPACSGLTICGGAAGCHMCEADSGNSIEWFSQAWDSTVKPADRALYGWDANPWVWVIEFERISKEEALKNGEESRAKSMSVPAPERYERIPYNSRGIAHKNLFPVVQHGRMCSL